MLGTFTKGLVQGLEELDIRGRVETIQTTTLLSSPRLLWRVQETWSAFYVIHTLMKDYQLMQAWKIHDVYDNNHNNDNEKPSAN